MVPKQVAIWIYLLCLAASGCGGGGGGSASSSGNTGTNATVIGRVLDTEGNPVMGATVSVATQYGIAETDLQGYFSAVVSMGQQQLIITKDSVTICLLTFQAGDNQTVMLGDISPQILYFVNGASWYEDADGDGYATGVSVSSSIQPNGFYLAENLMSTEGDCDDASAVVNPGRIEVCGDNIDNDCSAGVDEGCTAVGISNWDEMSWDSGLWR